MKSWFVNLLMLQNNHYHMFKWTHESVIEEVEDMIQKMDGFEGGAVTLEKGLRSCEFEIGNL